jgi:hypothetical protein
MSKQLTISQVVPQHKGMASRVNWILSLYTRPSCCLLAPSPVAAARRGPPMSLGAVHHPDGACRRQDTVAQWAKVSMSQCCHKMGACDSATATCLQPAGSCLRLQNKPTYSCVNIPARRMCNAQHSTTHRYLSPLDQSCHPVTTTQPSCFHEA